MSYILSMTQSQLERCFVQVVEEFAADLFQEGKRKDDPYNRSAFARAAYPEMRDPTMTWFRISKGERGIHLSKADDIAAAVGKSLAELIVLAKERMRRGEHCRT